MGHILFNGMRFHWSTQSFWRHTSFQKSTGACGVFLVPSSLSSMVSRGCRRHTGWAELGLLNLKKEGTTAGLSLNYLFLVTGNAERTSFAWRKTVISYKEKKSHNEEVQHWKSWSAICAPGDFQNGVRKSLPLTWKLPAVRRSMDYTAWKAFSNLNYSFIQITGYKYHYYCICPHVLQELKLSFPL